MKNKIIFTQDVPGERGWLQRQFPAHKNFETSSSGKWTAEFPSISDQATLHEIAYSDHYDLLTLLHSDVQILWLIQDVVWLFRILVPAQSEILHHDEAPI